eukprot:jgi/Bigna1/87867/estExt_fgenesh1_pg.C_250073
MPFGQRHRLVSAKNIAAILALCCVLLLFVGVSNIGRQHLGSPTVRRTASYQAHTSSSCDAIRRRSVPPMLGLAALSLSQLDRSFADEISAQSIISPLARAPKNVFIAGATGNTGRRTVEYLHRRYPSIPVIAGARSIEKAEKQGLSNLEGVTVRKFDVLMSKEKIVEAISGADTVVCVTGFVPSNPLAMKKAAHQVDNEGVSKFVLISSILTNGRAIGQETNPGFVITNAFGGVLDEKLVAEKYLRASGLDYTIVRPGGLKDSAPTGGVVATVMVEAAFDPAASNKVIEIIEDDMASTPSEKVFSTLFG